MSAFAAPTKLSNKTEIAAMHESESGPFLPFGALRRDVGNVMESGPNAHIAASRSLARRGH